jgi:hypothetical protein
MIVIACGAALLIAAAAAVAVVVALRNRQQPAPPPDAPVAALPAEVRVKAVERKLEPMDHEVVEASSAVAIVCGADSATSDRYEARNDALRSIARRRDLPEDDVAALIAYLRTADDAMRVERVAALKNDVMNLLRNQEPPVEGLAETLIAMVEGKGGNCGGALGDRALPCNTVHPPVVIDYCIQHLGAMLGELDEKGRLRVRAVLAKAAWQMKQPYAGTALYSLAEDARAMPSQDKELKGLALALCKPGVNHAARIAAIQLAGERGYADALPVLREILSSPSRDAVLDIAAIGSVGLLGDKGDVALLSRFSSDSRRAPAAETAVRRIKERGSVFGQD